MFKEEVMSLEKAAKVSGLGLESFIEKLGHLGIPLVNYSAEELDQELKDFGE